MRTATLVPDPAAVTLEEIAADEAGITLVLRARYPTACCPCCGEVAMRIHSWYTRTLGDLPWQGLAVAVRLRTRRWRCDNPACARRIFTERLPTVAPPHARRTRRLAAILLVFGVAVGGLPGARLLATLGIAVSGDTLRRLVGEAPVPPLATPRVLGVDDWSLRKGHTYGTILVDLEARRPIDLLPDRSAAGLETWLKAHPGVAVVARDRGGAYADGARHGAPDAVQVADRWHLFANLGDLLERVLTRHHAALAHVRLAAPPPPALSSDRVVETSASPAPEPPAPRPPRRAERERRERDARREARHATIHGLREQGLSDRAIAGQLGLNRRTIRRYATAPTCPHPGPRPRRRRAITPFLPHLRERWDAGERRVAVLWAEIRARGFPGAAPRVREALASWRRDDRAVRAIPAAAGAPAPRPARPVGKRCAPRQVAVWLCRAPEALPAAQRDYLDALDAADPALATARTLARAFVVLLRDRDAAALEPWLARAEASAVREFRDFAAGLRRDQAAIAAALTEPWSSGQVEGQVNRLKLLKRGMYGRAGFALLRRRFLLAA